jgi:hypothetical protein
MTAFAHPILAAMILVSGGLSAIARAVRRPLHRQKSLSLQDRIPSFFDNLFADVAGFQ